MRSGIASSWLFSFFAALTWRAAPALALCCAVLCCAVHCCAVSPGWLAANEGVYRSHVA